MQAVGAATEEQLAAEVTGADKILLKMYQAALKAGKLARALEAAAQLGAARCPGRRTDAGQPAWVSGLVSGRSGCCGAGRSTGLRLCSTAHQGCARSNMSMQACATGLAWVMLSHIGE